MAEGRAALITGGSSGIGLAVARALGQDGYGLTVSARRPEKLRSEAGAISSIPSARPVPPICWNQAARLKS